MTSLRKLSKNDRISWQDVELSSKERGRFLEDKLFSHSRPTQSVQCWSQQGTKFDIISHSNFYHGPSGLIIQRQKWRIWILCFFPFMIVNQRMNQPMTNEFLVLRWFIHHFHFPHGIHGSSFNFSLLWAKNGKNNAKIQVAKIDVFF